MILKSTDRVGRRIAGLFAVLLFVSACPGKPPAKVAYDTIDGWVTGVQSAMSAYKRHCNVPVGQTGPGSCTATEYAQADAAYVKFQGLAVNAIDIASKTGQTPLQVVSAAAAEALQFFASVGIHP